MISVRGTDDISPFSRCRVEVVRSELLRGRIDDDLADVDVGSLGDEIAEAEPMAEAMAEGSIPTVSDTSRIELCN